MAAILAPIRLRVTPPDIATAQALRRINAQHINANKLEAAMVDVINQYARFPLPRHWGSGHAAIADGTHVKLRENNLIGSRHIRYGGYGGIAYHHIADSYIALFTSFISCGVWEAVHILDGLMKNRSAIQPDTLHADTQGQSEPVFGLCRLLGIKLMPRMRGISDARLLSSGQVDPLPAYRCAVRRRDRLGPHRHACARHDPGGAVDPGRAGHAVDAAAKARHIQPPQPALSRVPRTRPRRAHAVPAALHLQHRDPPHIRAETTKIEPYNDFLDWVSFGGPVIKSGDPVEQEKQLKYASLVANAIMLSNVVDMTEVLSAMAEDGHPVTPALVACLSPYIREHIRRFGQYVLDMTDLPAAARSAAASVRDGLSRDIAFRTTQAVSRPSDGLWVIFARFLNRPLAGLR